MIKKTITSLDLDLSDIPQNGENRTFTILGSIGATFSMEVKNEDSYYYNFQTGSFQAAQTRLTNEVITSGGYVNNIQFPAVGDADQYDVYLYAGTDSEHIGYEEVRFGDGTLDINSSIGSNSNLLQRVIYQYLDVTLTMTSFPTTYDANWASASYSTQTFSVPRGKRITKKSFSITATTAATKALKIDSQPTTSDITVDTSITIGSAPEDIYGEDIYPAVNNTDTVDGAVGSGVKVVMDSNVASKMVVGDRITGNAATDTVDGEVGSGQKVVMDNNVATKMAVGDRITGNDA